MRPVTSQVAAEIGYDPAGGTDPGPFTQQVAERLHAADPRWGRRINSTGPISDDTVAYRVGTSPVNPLSIDIVLGRPYHPRPAPVAHLRSLGGDAGGPSHYIPAYLGSFFLFAGTKAAAREWFGRTARRGQIHAAPVRTREMPYMANRVVDVLSRMFNMVEV